MKYFTKTIGEKEYNFRITSSDIIEIEKKTGKSIQEVIVDGKFESVVTILRYLRKSTDPQFSYNNAMTFMDELIDEGYSLETVLKDIVYPACVESGILTQENLNVILDALTKRNTQ